MAKAPMQISHGTAISGRNFDSGGDNLLRINFLLLIPKKRCGWTGRLYAQLRRQTGTMYTD
jgi:hypothetical protein